MELCVAAFSTLMEGQEAYAYCALCMQGEFLWQAEWEEVQKEEDSSSGAEWALPASDLPNFLK